MNGKEMHVFNCGWMYQDFAEKWYTNTYTNKVREQIVYDYLHCGRGLSYTPDQSYKL